MRKHGILFHGYADDTQLYIRFRPGDAVSLADAIRRLEMCIQEIRMWMTANKQLKNYSTAKRACLGRSSVGQQ